MVGGSPAWNPHATFALVTTSSSRSSSPRRHTPNPSPRSAFRSICTACRVVRCGCRPDRCPAHWCRALGARAAQRRPARLDRVDRHAGRRCGDPAPRIGSGWWPSPRRAAILGCWPNRRLGCGSARSGSTDPPPGTVAGQARRAVAGRRRAVAPGDHRAGRDPATGGPAGRRRAQRGRRRAGPAGHPRRAGRRAHGRAREQGVARRRRRTGHRPGRTRAARARSTPSTPRWPSACAAARAGEVRRLVLTASGGPFRGRRRAELATSRPQRRSRTRPGTWAG